MDAPTRDVLQLTVVLVEACLRACRGMELKIEIEIIVYQLVEGSLRWCGRGHRRLGTYEGREQKQLNYKTERGREDSFHHLEIEGASIFTLRR
jgi:hypothetical protein